MQAKIVAGTYQRQLFLKTSYGKYMSPVDEVIDQKTLKSFKKTKVEEGAEALKAYLGEHSSSIERTQCIHNFCEAYGLILDQELKTTFGSSEITKAELLGIRVGLLIKIKEAVSKHACSI